VVLGAVSFVGIYNIIGGNDFMSGLLKGLDLPPLGVTFAMMGVLIILGTFMDRIAIVYITVPIFALVVASMAPELGLTEDAAKIWFGILFVMNIRIYLLWPPFGPVGFWLKSVVPPGITLQNIFAAVIPFIGLQIIGLALVMIFPEIAFFLPELINGKL
jgi:TRAP-type mannitol/chloroaromatic compound transport system permease large subunit